MGRPSSRKCRSLVNAVATRTGSGTESPPATAAKPNRPNKPTPPTGNKPATEQAPTQAPARRQVCHPSSHEAERSRLVGSRGQSPRPERGARGPSLGRPRPSPHRNVGHPGLGPAPKSPTGTWGTAAQVPTGTWGTRHQSPDRNVGHAGLGPAASMKRPRSAPSADRGPQERVGEGGVEPPRPYGHTDLNRARLPFRHSPSGRARIARRHGPPAAGISRSAARQASTVRSYRAPSGSVRSSSPHSRIQPWVRSNISRVYGCGAE